MPALDGSNPPALILSAEAAESIVYDLGTGSVVKDFSYSSSDLVETITLSGDVPSGIALTKNLVYDSGTLSEIYYS